jgi:FkbM family methyltransferase
MLAALTELARTGGVLYDIGAHMGFYTCAWLLLGGDSARVEAFEPAPYNLDTLRKNLAHNNLADRVNIHAVALGNSNGQANLVASEADIGAASAAYIDEMGYVDLPTGLSSHSLPNTRTMSVPVRRLDDLIAEKPLPIPIAIKLDIEGAEAAALAGAEHLLAQHHPTILCELHNIEAAVEVADLLAKLGYEIRSLGKNGAQPAYMWLPPSSRVDV